MRGRIPASSSYDDDDDDPPPPYLSYDQGAVDSGGGSEDGELPALGLLNGRYDMISSVSEQWSCYGSDFDLVLTLAGDHLWAKFDFAVARGIMYFPKRPLFSSREPVPFRWRGVIDQDGVQWGDRHHGWVKFLGGGRVKGEIDFMGVTFEGRRMSGQGTRSEVDARSMEREWNGYTQAEYDRQNRARWR